MMLHSKLFLKFFLFLLFPGGNTYESVSQAIQAGSGGGVNLADGGGVVFVSVEKLLELDGSIKSDGANGDYGGGGASGGTLWVAGRHFEGHGHLTVKGGAGSHRSECCSGSPCNSHRNYHGGGGGGGHLRHFSPDDIRRDIIRNRDVSGGASGGGSAGNGGSGQISAAGNQCSGHGTFSVQEGSCTCDAGSYVVSCLYQCDASRTRTLLGFWWV